MISLFVQGQTVCKGIAGHATKYDFWATRLVCLSSRLGVFLVNGLLLKLTFWHLNPTLPSESGSHLVPAKSQLLTYTRKKKNRLYIRSRLICPLQWESDWLKIGDWSHWKRLVENHRKAIGWKLKNWLKKEISLPSMAYNRPGNIFLWSSKQVGLCVSCRLRLNSCCGPCSVVQVFKSQGRIFPGPENRAQCNMRGKPATLACSSSRLVRLSLIREVMWWILNEERMSVLPNLDWEVIPRLGSKKICFQFNRRVAVYSEMVAL